MRSLSAVLVVLAAGSGLSCKRPLGVDDSDAGGVVGVPPLSDAAARDVAADAAAATCAAGVPPLDVCGCGCCGGTADGRACFYPSRGESRDAIPNPMPSPAECSTNGCTEGTRHLCCA